MRQRAYQQNMLSTYHLSDYRIVILLSTVERNCYIWGCGRFSGLGALFAFPIITHLLIDFLNLVD